MATTIFINFACAVMFYLSCMLARLTGRKHGNAEHYQENNRIQDQWFHSSLNYAFYTAKIRTRRKTPKPALILTLFVLFSDHLPKYNWHICEADPAGNNEPQPTIYE
jgi:hypothetical protein